MAEKSYHLIYLRPPILEDDWEHLHRFVHPGSKEKSGWLSLFCADLDLTGPFLRCRAKDFSGGGAKMLHLRYELVSSIVEVSLHSNPFGFVNSEEYLESPESK